jgi:hypothetical protein
MVVFYLHYIQFDGAKIRQSSDLFLLIFCTPHLSQSHVNICIVIPVQKLNKNLFIYRFIVESKEKSQHDIHWAN